MFATLSSSFLSKISIFRCLKIYFFHMYRVKMKYFSLNKSFCMSSGAISNWSKTLNQVINKIVCKIHFLLYSLNSAAFLQCVPQNVSLMKSPFWFVEYIL